MFTEAHLATNKITDLVIAEIDNKKVTLWTLLETIK